MADPLHLAVLDDERGGDAGLRGGFHVLLVGGAVRVGGQGVAGLLLPLVGVEELGDGVHLLVADADDDHLAVVLVGEVADVRHALLAGAAPGGPELDHVDLAGLEPRGLGAAHELLDLRNRGVAADGHRLDLGVFLLGVLRERGGRAEEGDRGGLGGAECVHASGDLHGVTCVRGDHAPHGAIRWGDDTTAPASAP